jgi:hypothetical protein
MSEHDPVRFAMGLSAKLATRSRHVCMLLGAGVGRACGLPDVTMLQDGVLKALGPEGKEAFARQLNGRTLEQALSRLRQIATLLTDGPHAVDGLSGVQAAELDRQVCQAIVKALDIKRADLGPVYHLAAWALRANYHLPVELFTVNYDLLLESAFEALRVRYFDGFVGSMQARFHIDLVEARPNSTDEWVPAFFVRLWKLHGSVNWLRTDNNQIVRLGQPVTDGLAAAIYPSDMKYEESRRVPFLVLQDHLRRALQHPETLTLITGYSYGDAHLNELLFDAAARRERSEFVAFCYSEIPDILSRQALTTPNLQVVGGAEAILGGVRARWKAPHDPQPNLWNDSKFGLGDFRNLATYLARSATREPEGDTLLRDLLTRNVAQRAAEMDALADG